MDEIVLDLYQTAIVAQALLEYEHDEMIDDILSRIERHVDGLRPITIVLDEDEMDIVTEALEAFEETDRGHGVSETLKSLEYYSDTYGKTEA